MTASTSADTCTCRPCTDLSAALDQLLLARLDVRRAAAEVDRVHRLDRLRDPDYGDDLGDDWRVRPPLVAFGGES